MSSRILEFPGTFGFDAQIHLMGHPGLGDLSGGFMLELYREFEFSNAWLVSEESDSLAFGHLGLEFSDASPVPEPATMSLTATTLPLLLSAIRHRAKTR